MSSFPVERQPLSTRRANGTACADLTLIFARGTFEPPDVGIFVGPGLISAVKAAIAPATFIAQGVSYPADVPGFFAGGDANGSRLTAQLVDQARTACPETKIVLSGYSQGAQLVHKGAAQLSEENVAAVNSGMIGFFHHLEFRSVTGCRAMANVRLKSCFSAIRSTEDRWEASRLAGSRLSVMRTTISARGASTFWGRI